MAKRKRRKSIKQISIEQAYRKERKRVLAARRRLEKQGFLLNSEAPAIPKRITENSIRKLKKITPSSIREKSLWLDYTTGEVIEGYRRNTIRKLRKEQKTEYVVTEYDVTDFNDPTDPEDDVTDVNDPTDPEDDLKTSIIIDNFIHEVRMIGFKELEDVLFNWMNFYIHMMTRDGFAELLTDAASQGIQIEVSEYDSEKSGKEKAIHYVDELMELSGEIGDISRDDFASAFYDYGW